MRLAKLRLVRVIIAFAWIVTVGLCLRWELRRGVEEGATGDPPANWPVSVGLPERSAKAATLLVAVHPRCPCTRASLTQLEAMCAGFGDEVRVIALVPLPLDAGAAWTRTATWRRIAANPRWACVSDEGGTVAAKLGIKTSGHVLAYNRDGRLVFSGGVTGSRGQQGDNPAAAALAAAIRSSANGRAPGREVGAVVMPVFGCGVVCSSGTRTEVEP